MTTTRAIDVEVVADGGGTTSHHTALIWERSAGDIWTWGGRLGGAAYRVDQFLTLRSAAGSARAEVTPAGATGTEFAGDGPPTL